MRNKIFPVGLFIVLTVVGITQSCRKVIDNIKTYENGQNDCRDCNIKQITINTSKINLDAASALFSYTIGYTFTYNAHGDPLTVKNTEVETGNPNMVFKYDKFGRMVELVKPYSNGFYRSWHKYSYNDRNQIIRDTQYIFGAFIDSVPVVSPYEIWVRQYSYDAKDRITQRIDSIFGLGTTSYGYTWSFSYDAKGNLVSLGTVYDSHLSLLRTNRIWMFLCNNYSINNGFQASSYNSHELPLSFEGSYSPIAFIVPFSGQFVVQYGCN